MFYDSLSYKLALAAKPPTLDELLALTSKESGEEKSVFDPETDKKLDGYMDNLVKKRREEWRKNNGG